MFKLLFSLSRSLPLHVHYILRWLQLSWSLDNMIWSCALDILWGNIQEPQLVPTLQDTTTRLSASINLTFFLNTSLEMWEEHKGLRWRNYISKITVLHWQATRVAKIHMKDGNGKTQAPTFMSFFGKVEGKRKWGRKHTI